LADPGNRLVNYTVSTNNGTLTVNPAALAITANSTNKVYGTVLTFAGTEFTAGGLTNSDLVTSATLASPGADANAAPGSYTITVTNAIGSGLTNYLIGYTPGILTVVAGANPTNRITAIAVNSDGSVTLNIATTPGYAYRVQTTTNLTLSAWGDVWTNAIGTNALWQFNDANATNYPQRYYRTVCP
jgi:hypothetical protein